MTMEQVTNLVLTLAPDILVILSFIGVLIKVVNEFSKLKKQVTDMKSVEDTQKQLSELLHDNLELKKQLNELLTKIDHVERK